MIDKELYSAPELVEMIVAQFRPLCASPGDTETEEFDIDVTEYGW